MVHLLCGFVGSGKTTLAKQLAANDRAVRFTLDDWMLRLFDLTPYEPEYGEKAERCKELIWDVAVQVLSVGVDVVLDWSQWSRAARRHWREQAASVGALAVLHYVDVPLDVAVEQVRRRNQQSRRGTHWIDPAEMRDFAEKFFEAPTRSEGMTVIIEEAAPER